MTTPIKKFRLTPPIGNIVAPETELNEAELREFAFQVNNIEDGLEVWREKIEKDKISEIVEWFRGAGYKIEEI